MVPSAQPFSPGEGNTMNFQKVGMTKSKEVQKKFPALS